MTEPEQFDAVVIGSGFGGTIAATTLTDHFLLKKQGKVCILERGQWWVSHEITFTPKDKRTQKPNMLEYLADNNAPYGFWAHPDNVEGLFKLLSMSRLIQRKGLYDLRILSPQVSAITASGVGGGSLVYSNVTVRPHESVYKDWPTEKEGKSIGEYFVQAEDFIGINKITTVAGLGNAMLERSKTFQEATDRLAKQQDSVIINKNDYSLNLAISDIPDKLFNYFTLDGYNSLTKNSISQLTPELIAKLAPDLAAKLTPDLIAQFTPDDIKNLGPDLIAQLVPKVNTKYQNSMEANVCERQGRCNLGCIPGARHTMNKKLFQALLQNKPLEVRPLCEANFIEFKEGENYPYIIHYKQFDKNDKASDKTIRANILVVCSGTLGTTELLQKSKAKGLALSNKVGERFSTNADLLGYMKLDKKKIDITRGPINTSHAMFKTGDKEFAFNIEDTAIPQMVADLFATIFELYSENKRRRLSFAKRLSLVRRFGVLGLAVLFMQGASLSQMQKMLMLLANNPIITEVLALTGSPKTFGKMDMEDTKKLSPYYTLVNWLMTDHDTPFASPSERLANFFVFSCMGIDNSDGVLSLKTNWQEIENKNELVEKLQLQWSADNNKKIFEDIIDGMKKIADQIEPNGSQRVVAPTWKETPSDSTLVLLHPLGGCPMGMNIEGGVVNNYGQVYQPDLQDKKNTYKNFYIMDGSIIPMAVGVNPSLTISAVSFRCVEHLIQNLGN